MSPAQYRECVDLTDPFVAACLETEQFNRRLKTPETQYLEALWDASILSAGEEVQHFTTRDKFRDAARKSLLSNAVSLESAVNIVSAGLENCSTLIETFNGVNNKNAKRLSGALRRDTNETIEIIQGIIARNIVFLRTLEDPVTNSEMQKTLFKAIRSGLNYAARSVARLNLRDSVYQNIAESFEKGFVENQSSESTLRRFHCRSAELARDKAHFEEMMNLTGKVEKDITQHNLRLVVDIAKNYVRPECEFLDLVGEGNLALIRAIKAFDLSKGLKFSTCAATYIKNGLIEFSEEKDRLVQTTSHAEALSKKLNYARETFYKENGRHATDEELADLAGTSVEMLRKCRKPVVHDISKAINLSNADAGNSSLIQESDLNSSGIITRAMNVLNFQEKLVIHMRLGLSPEGHFSAEEAAQGAGLLQHIREGIELTLRDIGEKLSLTHGRIRQVETAARSKMIAAMG